MTTEKKNFIIELIKSVAMVVIAGVIMGFIMRPSSNKDEIQTIKSDLRVEQTKIEVHDNRISELEKAIKQVATKEDLKTLKEDLIRELKK
jgi:cell division protein FtsL